MVSYGSMNTQINVRLPEKLLLAASSYAEEYGFGNVQELIKESLRERLFESEKLSKEEFIMVQSLAKVSAERNLYGTEEELFKKLKRE